MAQVGSISEQPAGLSGLCTFLPSLLDLSRLLLLPLLDALSVLLLPLSQSQFGRLPQHLQQYLAFWALLAATTLLLIRSYGGYRNWTRQRAAAAALAVRVSLASTIAMLATALLLGHEHAVTWNWTAAELCLPPLLMVFTRTATAASLVAAPDQAGPLVICFNQSPADLPEALAAQGLARRPSGVLFLADAAIGAPPNWPVLADVTALLATARAGRVKDVILVYQPALEDLSNSLRRALLSDLLVLPVRIWLAFSLAADLPLPLSNGAGRCRLVPVATENLVNSLTVAKRGFDIIAGVSLLAAAMPILALIALAVRLEGPGPVVFRQRRVGAHGHSFDVLKFRTMRHTAGAAFAQAVPGDARITRVGRLLRQTSLDELLQLVNVIRGDMSLVGPRPHAPETQVGGIDFEQAVQYYRLRHRVRPGMTGLAQIRGQRGETRQLETLEQRIASDLEYIDTWSIWLDISILLRTLPTLFGGRNAH